MTWINTIAYDQSGGELREYYEQLYAMYPPEYEVEVDEVRRADGSSDRVTASHSLLPEVMYHIFAAYGKLLDESIGLSRMQQEMIATLVSSENRCFY